MSIKELQDMTGSQKGALVYRVSVAVLLMAGTVIMGGIFGYVKSSDEKLTQTASDVAQIKWELPVIKDTANRDKLEVSTRITTLENRLESLRSLGDSRSTEISSLKTEIALLKQRLP